jgi:hypothetical protein
MRSSSGSISGRNGTQRSPVIIERYCDDFVLGFQYEAEARRMLVDLKERLAKVKLALHEEKTRLMSSASAQVICAGNAARATARRLGS